MNCEEKFKESIRLLKKVQTLINIPGEEASDGEIVDAIFNLKIGEFLDTAKLSECLNIINLKQEIHE